jgi:hypothetical protein
LQNKNPENRPQGGQWSDDDYDVFDGERHIGRILRTYFARAKSSVVRG